MTRPDLRAARSLPLAAALLFGTLAAPAFAQGTPEQREACTPDAVRLCSDTIPDIGKTKACMRRHEAELSPRCHAAFLGGPGPADRNRVARAAPDATPPAAVPDDDDVVAGVPDVDEPDVDVNVGRSQSREARRVIAQLCHNETLDASTCRIAGFALDMAR